jgi:hypothetical protein
MRTIFLVLFSFAYTVSAFGADSILEISLAEGVDTSASRKRQLVVR